MLLLGAAVFLGDQPLDQYIQTIQALLVCLGHTLMGLDYALMRFGDFAQICYLIPKNNRFIL